MGLNKCMNLFLYMLYTPWNFVVCMNSNTTIIYGIYIMMNNKTLFIFIAKFENCSQEVLMIYEVFIKDF